MSDAPFSTACNTDFSEQSQNGCSNTVCVDASRIYDSCGAKDCLSDLTLLFTEDDQILVNNACSVRICKARVITATVDVEPVAFHRGFYAVDMMFYFDVAVDVYTSTGATPGTVNGLAMYGKRVVLYGSEGSAKTFSSEGTPICIDNENSCTYSGSLPKASVQISDPMALSAKLHDCGKPCGMSCASVPKCVVDYFGCGFVQPQPKWITVTIGIFTITQLERNVQLMIPSYDFCVPRKECPAKTDDPCEVFSKIEFPTDSFFPPKVGDCDRDCSCDR
ncbi:MAG: hypothetical protein U0L20_06775 [Ruminococcus sp.]|nr:hypothetical protein [Ruminococcus sp.]